MNHIAVTPTSTLPSLIAHAAQRLSAATNAAEILEARDMASVAYDAAKKAARLGVAKKAHDDLIAAAYRVQADALEIESNAKRRLADEYDAAQERGEVQSRGGDGSSKAELPTAADIGLSRKDIHEARLIRDAEIAEPGIARRAIDARLSQGLEPNKAALREAVMHVAKLGGRESAPSNRNPIYRAPSMAGKAWTHIYGECRAMAEWATEENISLAMQGRKERTDDQTANISAIRKAAAILTQIAEEF